MPQLEHGVVERVAREFELGTHWRGSLELESDLTFIELVHGLRVVGEHSEVETLVFEFHRAPPLSSVATLVHRPLCSGHESSAVYVDRAAGDMRRRRAAQEHDRSRDLLGMREANRACNDAGGCRLVHLVL